MAARGTAMPLTEFQAAIARLLATNRSPDSYLAGGAALHIEPNSKRYSNDLDYSISYPASTSGCSSRQGTRSR